MLNVEAARAPETLVLCNIGVCRPEGDHSILLDMAEALCEAKWMDQGIRAKCISCFGPNGDFAKDGLEVSSALWSAPAFERDDDTVLAYLLSSAFVVVFERMKT